MRKQTKLVAVASAAALLAIGASMTSFAATGWVEENGEWFYYEKDGSKAEYAWKKSGDKWFWLDSEESGAMAVDKIVAYADGKGKLYNSAIKKIKSKYYGFRPDDGEKGGAMLSGLVLMQVSADGTIVDILDDGVDADDLSNILDGTTTVPAGYSLYFFGNDADSDGALKTGSTTIVLDGDSYNFYFSKSGGVEGKGKGVSGIDDNKYIYMYGCRLKADSDDKYQLVKVTGTDKGIGSSTAIVSKEESRDIRTDNTLISSTTDVNRDDEYVLYADDTAVCRYVSGKFQRFNCEEQNCCKRWCGLVLLR